MTTYKRICIKDHTVIDGEKVLNLKRGTEYITSEEKDGRVFVMSMYWGWVPASIFAGEVKFT